MPFGTFNPRFYGISLLSDGGDQISALADYMQSRTVSNWLKEQSVSQTDSFVVSAPDHESRHFHDFLLSPFGTHIMGLRMQASLNGLQAIKQVRESSGRFLPVPLNRWLEWDLGMKESWVLNTGHNFGIDSLNQIIFGSASEVSSIASLPGLHPVSSELPPEVQGMRYALATKQAFDAMDELRRRKDWGLGIDIAADDVFEASAHIAQAQAIWMGQGQDATDAYFRFLETSKTRYLQPYQVLVLAMNQDRSHPPSIRRMLELFTWMMLGASNNPFGSGNPAWRLNLILSVAATCQDLLYAHPELDSAHFWDYLDEITRSSSWRDAVLKGQVSADRRRAAYGRASRRLTGGFFDALFGVAEFWHQDQLTTRSTFLGDPQSYVEAERYLTESRYPRPSIECRFGNSYHKRDVELDSDYIRAVTADDEGKLVLSYIAAHPKERLEHIHTARLFTHFVDFVFLDEPIVALYENYLKQQLEQFLEKELISVY